MTQLNKKFLEEEYIKKQKSIREIAEEFGFTKSTILWWLTKYNIPRRPPVKRLKYSGILTKDFLEKEYLQKKKSATQIGKEIGCHPFIVLEYIDRYSIKKRGIGEANLLSLTNPKLTKEFLYREYIIKKRSSISIGKECGVSSDTIINYLKRYGIPIRERGLATHLATRNYANIDKKLENYLDGLLLGDGCICSKNMRSAVYFQGATISNEEWIKKIKDDLEVGGISSKIQYIKGRKRVIVDHIANSKDSVLLRTLSYPELTRFRERWYPNGKKIIPHDISITPSLVMNWFLGDGSFNKCNGSIILSTDCFPQNDVLWLSSKLNREIGISSRVYYRQGKPIIVIGRKKDSSIFLDYIGKCPVECFKYKWGIE